MSDEQGTLSRRELAARVAGVSAELRGLPQVIGLLGANGIDWAVAQLAAWMAGKTVVPLPSFFSGLQLEHILRDAGIDHVVATPDALDVAASLGTGITPISKRRSSETPVLFARRGHDRLHLRQQRPAKGRASRHRADRLAGPRPCRSDRGHRARYQFVGLAPRSLARDHYRHLRARAGWRADAFCFRPWPKASAWAGPSTMAAAFERTRPSTAVLVPQLLSGLGCAACGRQQAGTGQLALRRSRRRARLRDSDRARLGARHPRARGLRAHGMLLGRHPEPARPAQGAQPWANRCQASMSVSTTARSW